MIGEARILIVDDELPIRTACARILTQEGARVETAEDGIAGLEKARAGPFDLALVDLKMPRMDGMELLAQLTRLDPEMIKIVITGYATLETAIEAVQKGAYDYLPKPFSPGELRSRVNRGLEKRFLLVEANRLREERERNLLELANEKSRIQTIMDCMGDGVVVINRARQVVFCNPAGRRLLQVKRLLPAGEPLSGVSPNPELTALMEGTLLSREGAGISSRELAPLQPNDPVLMVNAAPVKDEKGEVIGAVAVLRDITELKELDKAKSTFVSMVAHELRAPLAAIEGYLDVILENVGGSDPERTHRILERSRERTRGLLALIDDLLAISRTQSGRLARERERVDLGALLKETAEFIQGKANERQVGIVLEIADDLPRPRANREELTRVFTNLLDNAVKYNRRGGRIVVRAAADPGFARVEIQDTGIGISPEDRARIFDEFYRVKGPETRSVVGTGLGLAIAKKLVEAHDGHIEVESTPREGSTFRVLLPV